MRSAVRVTKGRNPGLPRTLGREPAPAVQPGTAIISSGQPACGPSAPPKGSSQGSGTLECGAILVFRVTVTVVR